MGLFLNNAGSLLGLSSPLDRSAPRSSFAGIKHGLLLQGMFPFAVVHAAVLLFCLFPLQNRRVPALSFAQIKPGFPARGVFPSALLHAAILFLCLYPPLFNSLTPPRIIEERWVDPRLAPHDSLVMTRLYYSAKMALNHSPAPIRSARNPSNASSLRPTGSNLTLPAHLEETATAQSTYSGPQEIVSISPDSTNSIQTILRPDVVNPPTLKFPQLLKPVVILPSSVPAVSAAEPVNPVALPLSAQPIKNPPVELPVAKVAHFASLPVPEVQRQRLPEIESEAASRSPLAAIVLNAVTVPENAPVAVPNAELHGSFAVLPVHSEQSTDGEGASGESTQSSNASKAANKAAQGKAGEAVDVSSETPTRKGWDGPNASGKSSAGDNAGNSISNRSSQVTGTSRGGDIGNHSQAAHAAPGMIIIGGTVRGGSSEGVRSTTPATYGLTVISSGTSGGASRDLGVFERSETVYTVYIPMADVGGGPDWSIQYAILGTLQAGNVLLTPPVAVKKVRALVTGDLPGARPAIIFFSGAISAKGELTVKLPRQMDAGARQALDALCQWEFLPAQLNGNAVAIKVLIGAGILSQ